LKIRIRNQFRLWEFFPEPFQEAFERTQENELVTWQLVKLMDDLISFSDKPRLVALAIKLYQEFEINLLYYLGAECLELPVERYQILKEFAELLSVGIYKKTRMIYFQEEVTSFITDHPAMEVVERFVASLRKFKSEKTKWFSQRRMGGRFPLDILLQRGSFPPNWHQRLVKVIEGYSVREARAVVQGRFPVEIWKRITEFAYPPILIEAMDNERYIKSKIYPVEQKIIVHVSSFLSLVSLCVAYRVGEEGIIRDFKSQLKACIVKHISNRRLTLTLLSIEGYLTDSLNSDEFDTTVFDVIRI
jgi:hypothetical protein